jgi:precorrin-2 dehydrogenase/sirohydrochlorin ferrochelatase
MGYLPIFLDVAGRPCIVIGDGEVAEGKVRALIEAGANVTVVSAAASAALTNVADKGELRHVPREYEYGDLHGNYLAYVASRDPETARRAAEEARELGILINIADNPERSNFISPAIVKSGDLQIAISTSGASPAVARKLREQMQQRFGPEYAFLLEIMRRARRYLRRHQADQRERARRLNALAVTLLGSVDALDDAHIDEALNRHLEVGMEELDLKSSGDSEPRRAISEIPR